MLIRFLDLIISLSALLLLLPLFLILSILLVLFSGMPVIYRQIRVGKNNTDFVLLKFRTMRPGSDSSSLLTVGDHDSRVTAVGKWLRKYKLDELPQLINVLRGEMSLVGPRPEVRKYVDQYTPEQKKVLNVRPGITDHASIVYANENELLAQSDDPEKLYCQEILPAKIELNLKFLEDPSTGNYFLILWKTFLKILF